MLNQVQIDLKLIKKKITGKDAKMFNFFNDNTEKYLQLQQFISFIITSIVERKKIEFFKRLDITLSLPFQPESQNFLDPGLRNLKNTDLS